jgi:DNA-directed RNA polymerase subunit M
MFCPKCGTLMTPREGEWVCPKCGHQSGISEEDRKAVLIEEAKEKETIVIREEDIALPMDKSVTCPKCGGRGAYWMLRQTRGADEPETRFYICKTCGYRWREY